MIDFIVVTLFFGGPIVVLGILGYRYGYRQQTTPLGIVWRTLIFCSVFSWSLAGGQSHDVGLALPFPSVVCLFFLFSRDGPR